MHLVKNVTERIYSISKNECNDYLKRKKENDNFTDFEKRRFWVEPQPDESVHVVLDNTSGECQLVFLSSFFHAIAYILNLEKILSKKNEE